MSGPSWEQALSELEAALAGLEQAGPDDLEDAALALGTAGPPAVTAPIPAALEERAHRVERRMDALVHDLEGRRAAVGSEIAALAGGMTPAERPVPRFLDTRA